MIAFPAIAAIVAFACAMFVGWDAWTRPRPERVAWTIAFLVFAVAAAAEVIGGALGWNATLARVYYLAGAVLVVGILALGELYLLAPGRMPALTPGIALFVSALSATVVWSAPIDGARLQDQGWSAIERGPLLVALAAAINAGGTLVLAGGALYSAWRLRAANRSRERAIGCILIAVGTVIVAAGGALTRFGHREYLYIAMALGVSIIFLGVLMTRSGWRARGGLPRRPDLPQVAEPSTYRARLVPLPGGAGSTNNGKGNEGITYVVTRLLPLDDADLAAECRRWSASPLTGDLLSREQARQVWALRRDLPGEMQARFDDLPLATRAQLAELYREVWRQPAAALPGERHA